MIENVTEGTCIFANRDIEPSPTCQNMRRLLDNPKITLNRRVTQRAMWEIRVCPTKRSILVKLGAKKSEGRKSVWNLLPEGDDVRGRVP